MDHRRAALGEWLTEFVSAQGTTHRRVAVVVGAGRGGDPETTTEVELHLRAILRRLFADPGMVHQVGRHQFVVLVHRHPGLALTLATLAQELALDPLMVGLDLRVSYQAFPESVDEIPAFLDRVSAAPVSGVPSHAGFDSRMLAEPRPRVTSGGQESQPKAWPVLPAATAACVAMVLVVGWLGMTGVVGPFGPAAVSSTSMVLDPGAPSSRGGEAVLGITETSGARSGPSGGDADAGHGDNGPSGAGRGATSSPGHPEDQPTGGDEASPAPVDASPSAEEAVGAVLVVVGMDASAALELVREDVVVTTVHVGVPDANDVPPGALVVALEGPAPGDLCALLALRPDAEVVGDEAICDAEGVEVPVS